MVKQSYLLTDLFLDLLSRDSRHASPESSLLRLVFGDDQISAFFIVQVKRVRIKFQPDFIVQLNLADACFFDCNLTIS